MSRTVFEKLPEFGLEMLSAALNPDDRQWVPLLRTKYMRYRFPSFDQAEGFVEKMKRSQPHVPLRIVPLD